MTTPKLDEQVQREINSLNLKEFSYSENFTFAKILMYHGVNALMHNYLSKRLKKEVIEEKKTINEFCTRYLIRKTDNVADSYHRNYSVSLNTLKSAEIYIPWQRTQRVNLFHKDSLEVISKLESRQRLLFEELIAVDIKELDKKLTQEDFVIKMNLFSIHLWNGSVDLFEKYKDGYDGNSKIKPQKEEITNLGRKLLEYYSDLICSI